MTTHEQYMQRCLDLASLGLGQVQPNPMVGAVLVVDNQIIGEGYHRKYGMPHAEVNAINAVKEPELLKKATLYVNLEPCSHFGKTPPCADLIIEKQIPKVVIGNIDPNAKVNGEGIRKLQNAGIEVITGVLEDECNELNKRFFTYHLKKRPYIILKWAQTADGFMDIDRSIPENIHPYWITNPEIRVITHKWRSEEDAILIGYKTLLHDNPQLNTRYYPGKDPKRYVLSKQAEDQANYPGYHFLPENLTEALQILHEQKIESVIVEGGKKTLERFLSEDLWDEARILTGNQHWGKGLPAPRLNLLPRQEEFILDNRIQYVRRHV